MLPDRTRRDSIGFTWAAREVGNAGISDEEHLEYAAKEQPILFTHDPDLIAIAQRWMGQGTEHWGVLYVAQNHLTVGECIRRLREYATILDAEDMKSDS